MVMGSFASGRQQLQCAGVRANIPNRRRSAFQNGKTEDTPPLRDYVGPWLGVFATNAPEILAHPKIRAEIWGGGVQARFNAVCFADIVDPLINASWDGSVDLDDEEDGAPTLKKRKL
ncbi:hypothetical protein EMCG_06680 [[Emmonsia] crescens]|uniref:Uncharacterized protein n=1 Tax=[Emmonsia] crescens TaxID=73230 RepID=A0A0G2IBG7_9EURO|nr:hypothetical protein EMCG_06680 [Emmonsia crescens UAMH 3008]